MEVTPNNDFVSNLEEPEEKRRAKSFKPGLLILEIFGILLMALFFSPFILVLINAAKDNNSIISDPTAFPAFFGGIAQIFTNIGRILENESVRYIGSFFNSLIITSASLLLIGILSAMAAWVLVRRKTNYSFFIFMFFLSGMVIPFQVVMIPLVQLLSQLRQLTGIPFKDTIWGILIAYIGFGAPLSIFLFHGFIKSVPTDIEEAAIIDGCTKPQVFFRVVLPILKPIFVTLLVLNGMWIWNDYLLPSLVIGTQGDLQTLPMAVMFLVGSYLRQWDLILTSVLLAALPVIILFLFAQKYIIRGMTSGAIK